MNDGSVTRSGAKVDDSYFEHGKTWEASIYRNVMRQRNWLAVLSLFLVLGILLSIATLFALVPLKQTELVTLLVDKTTGFVEVARPLDQDSPLKREDAVTMYSAVRFVRARETYDSTRLQENFDLAALFSTGKALDELMRDYAESNPRNLLKIYGKDGDIRVYVESVVALNAEALQIRYIKKGAGHNGLPVDDHMIALIRYRVSGAPMRQDLRFDNPQGFQVTEFRPEQEREAPMPAPEDHK